jgi:hypothetical protein
MNETGSGRSFFSLCFGGEILSDRARKGERPYTLESGFTLPPNRLENIYNSQAPSNFLSA